MSAREAAWTCAPGAWVAGTCRKPPTPRCGDVYDPDGRPDDPPCRLPAGHDGWHSDGVGGMWEE